MLLNQGRNNHDHNNNVIQLNKYHLHPNHPDAVDPEHMGPAKGPVKDEVTEPDSINPAITDPEDVIDPDAEIDPDVEVDPEGDPPIRDTDDGILISISLALEFR